jgi:Ca2+-binding RTX toxin-like protein
MLKDHVPIAYGTTTENAAGGVGNDTITGNNVANILSEGTGNDTLSPVGRRSRNYLA